MDAKDWALSLDDLPAAFAEWPETARRVARPVYNGYLMMTGTKSTATAKTIRNLTARGISSSGKFPHEAP